MPKQNYLECGKILNTHGVRGAVRVEPWTNTPEILMKLPEIYLNDGGEMKPVRILKASKQHQFVLLSLEGIEDMDEAAQLKGSVIFASRDSIPLPLGESFIADLIGLPVIDADSGEKLGEVTDVINYGASDLYEVRTKNGTKLIPAIPQFVAGVDLDKGIFIHVIEGLLD